MDMDPRSRLKDEFLSDPDNLHYIIKCVECKNPLWEARVLKRHGSRVVSTETKKCSGISQKFDRRNEWCPLCGRKFYGQTVAKGQLYLIEDLNSGITRLI